ALLRRDAPAGDADAADPGDGPAAADPAVTGGALERTGPCPRGADPARRALDAAHADAGGAGDLRPRAAGLPAGARADRLRAGRRPRRARTGGSARARRAAGTERRLSVRSS